MFGIFQADGLLILDSIKGSRKSARQSFATEHAVKWGHLWELGYRVRAIKNPLRAG